mmetsp:Transcript_16961/g.21692  ORF Transcript_16961/g.21692 Transcript_16961/m.21692 type:complete len:479 (+) Transcript_16961:374-1810(+)|eukprot:CAMPEP_0204833910 /NCGR_PEP_ID=MMETSP1346-20131115/18158_1 /ASSEMBLY_ACC=CAM_ASM_000771 /TAXON_ID=215587 /ORGANISM="Aplanochytrium stocchinoi, Strain GSBS06" /LENGTH=478 /DNA_ID=CAMNT_0051966789 /DNA_START=40 /DNA_END=1476 /DNA_ORIENTATION=+
MSDSEYSSSSSSSSSSGSDFEEMDDLLGRIGMKKKYSKLFSKADVIDIEDAKELTEKQLKKMGIGSSSDRKKIMRAIEEATSSDDSDGSSDSDSDSDSSDDEASDSEKLQRVLRSIGLKKYGKILKSNRISSLSKAQDLDDRKLKKFGISSSTDRKLLLKAFSKNPSRSNSSKGSDSDFDEIADLLDKAGLKKYAKAVKNSKVRSLKDVTKLDDKALKRAGVDSEKTRSKIIKALQSDSKSTKKRTSPLTEKEMVVRILKDTKLKEFVKVFEKKGIDSLKKASALSPDNLRSMGITTLSQRSALISAFSNSYDHLHGDTVSSSSEDEEDDIKKALKRAKQQQYVSLFRKRDITSIRQAQDLKHPQLKDLGIDNAGIREVIMEAFAEADWKCTYCMGWNSHRKTCETCQKVKRAVNENAKFELQQAVKYIGKFRPTTRVKYGDKGRVHRVLPDDFYMVNVDHKDKKIKIRLAGNELKAC